MFYLSVASFWQKSRAGFQQAAAIGDEDTNSTTEANSLNGITTLFAAGGPTRLYFTPLDLNLMPGPPLRHRCLSFESCPTAIRSIETSVSLSNGLPRVVMNYIVPPRVSNICKTNY